MKRPAHLQMKDYLVMLSVVKRGHRLLPQWRVLQSDTMENAVNIGVADWREEDGEIIKAGARVINEHSTGLVVITGDDIISQWNELCLELGLPFTRVVGVVQ